MTAFSWDKMIRTPEGALIKKQGERTQEELVKAFRPQAETDLVEHDEYEGLRQDVNKRLPELIHGTENEKENAAREIADVHEKTLRNNKDLEDIKQQIAYILALAEVMDERKRRSH